ncbi:predicted protein [Phaeodactylum tricornutum CCAP 1055/1]|jgi:hypothetical protein|uniref:Uncharacterized protein n=2 Tax=Phaeodactylum tricornutum TaxID=2850 RepID=B7G8B4_PHATC|nr:predicted protein [Phaeodactylum tricornutum CCAP 1055/1]EEC45016.1 predicted protein [Phaeodactylum tricornutum CCAP 1055/1]|eukprot:XP_002183316.1 predicted protein [Phaeodactylum tricornutum CCAP 1055/1]
MRKSTAQLAFSTVTFFSRGACFELSTCRSVAPYYSQIVTSWLDENSLPWTEVEGEQLSNRRIINVTGKQNNLRLHLLPSPTCPMNCASPNLTRDMTNRASKNDPIIHLHQDVWQAKEDIVKSRLLQRLGRIKRRIYARQTVARRIDNPTAVEFLQCHHLWAATRTKFAYGLYTKDDIGELVAVASFSSRRNVVRKGVNHRSHELIRFCSRRDETVIGGITKLIRAFAKDENPDDIVTVIDRDWGGGDGWHALGFQTVATLPSLIMAVKAGTRHHMVGAGIGCKSTSAFGRIGLPADTLQRLNTTSSAEAARSTLLESGHFPVYDAGVERLLLLVSHSSAAIEHGKDVCAKALWSDSQPSYTSRYYSSNCGITALLTDAEKEHKRTEPFKSERDLASI